MRLFPPCQIAGITMTLRTGGDVLLRVAVIDQRFDFISPSLLRQFDVLLPRSMTAFTPDIGNKKFGP